MNALSPATLRRGERMWGASPNGQHTAATVRPRMRLVSWKSLVKGSLRGFATIELPIGLRIIDVPVLVSNGKAWASLPSKPQLVDGRQKLDGKPLYAPMLEWRDKALRDRFSDRVIELVRAEYLDALDDGEAPK